MGVRTTGSQELARKLRNYSIDLRRESVSILKQEARAHAVQLGSLTMPGPGFNETNAAKFRGRVDGDVRKVYASKQDPSAIYALMRKHAPLLAKAYWRAHKAGKPRAAADILRRASLPEGIEPDALRRARTGKKGRVNGRKNPVSIATEAQVRAFSKRQSQLVGLAKAGFYAAAKAIGGRVRRAVVDDLGGRRTEEIFPAWIRKLATRFPGLGGARVNESLDTPTVWIWTNVKHADEALSGPLYASAVSDARANVRKALEKAMKILNERGSKRAA